MRKDLYFVAVMPQEEIRKEVTAFKIICREEYNSVHALRSPPHITLIPPMRMDQDELKRLEDALSSVSENHVGFNLTLDGFAKFGTSVIFVHIESNDELTSLFDSLKEKVLDVGLPMIPTNRAFHPHMTIAFKDLTKNQFYPAWERFKNMKYERFMEVSDLFLLKHKDKKWEVWKSYPLQEVVKREKA